MAYQSKMDNLIQKSVIFTTFRGEINEVVMVSNL